MKTIGISLDGSLEDARWLLDRVREEFEVLMDQEFDLRFPEDRILAAGYRAGRAQEVNSRLLADPSLDLVIALGPLVSADLVGRRDLPRPAIAPLALGSISGQLPRAEDGAERGGSGVPNLTYVQPVFDLAHDIERFRELVEFETLGLMGPRDLLNALAGLTAGQRTRLEELGVELVGIEVGPSMAIDTAALADDLDAVFLLGPPPGAEGQVQDWIEPLHARGLPTFAITGEIAVREGVLAGLTPADWWPRLARRTALVARRLLVGEDAASIPVRLPRDETFTINMSTARALGVSPTFDLMSEAVLLGESQRDPTRVFDLREAMNEAFDRNRELAAFRRRVEAGREDVAIARAVLLPQTEVSLGHRWIDGDRAGQGALGAERTLAASLEVSQVIWSEQAWANLSVQGHLVRALEATLGQRRLEVGLEAASAYFDVLSAKADERIRRDNLRLTRSNFERARVREQLGAASPAESYRWESQVALDQDALVTAIARRNLAEIEFNRVLDLPLEEKIGLVDVGEIGGPFAVLDPRLLPHIDDPASLRRFRAFAAGLARENSPELAQLDASIAARERGLRSATRSFYSPELAVRGNVERTLDRWGEGAALLDAAPVDRTNYEFTLGLSLPVFEGARRFAERSQAAAELRRLRREREAAVQRVEQRTRGAIHLASASFTRIELTRTSMEASRQNFELVADSYARGAVSIIELLDAQTAYLNAQQRSASATYQFLADVMEVERAVGRFFVLAPRSERDEIFARLEDFVEAPVSPSTPDED